MKKKDYRVILEGREWGRLREIQIETNFDVWFTFCSILDFFNKTEFENTKK